MKLKRNSGKKFLNLHNGNKNFIYDIKNLQFKKERDLIIELLKFCDANKVHLYATKSQVAAMKKYTESGYLSPKKPYDILRSKLILMNLQSILSNSLLKDAEKRALLPSQIKRKNEVEANIKRLNDAAKEGFGGAIDQMFFKTRQTNRDGKVVVVKERKNVFEIENSIQSYRKRLLEDVQKLKVENKHEPLTFENMNNIIGNTNLSVEIRNRVNSAIIIENNFNQITERDYAKLQDEIQAYCDSKNASIKSQSKLKKMTLGLILTATLALTSLNTSLIFNEKFNNQTSIEEPEQKVKVSNSEIAEHIFESDRYDNINFNKYTEVDFNADIDYLSDYAGRSLNETDAEEIIEYVNDMITEKLEKEDEEKDKDEEKEDDVFKSSIQVYNGKGYKVELSDTEFEDGMDLVLNFTIDNGFVYDDKTNAIQIENAKADAVNITLENDILSIKLSGLKIENEKNDIAFSIGDLEVKALDYTIIIDQSNNYGTFSNLSENADNTYTFDFAVGDGYSKTLPVFQVNGIDLPSTQNIDGSYTYTVSEDILGDGGDMVVEDVSNWELNRYEISYNAGDGWGFESMPNNLVHGTEFNIYVSLPENTQKLPTIYANGLEINPNTSGSYGLVRYRIVALEDTTITGEDLVVETQDEEQLDKAADSKLDKGADSKIDNSSTHNENSKDDDQKEQDLESGGSGMDRVD